MPGALDLARLQLKYNHFEVHPAKAVISPFLLP